MQNGILIIQQKVHLPYSNFGIWLLYLDTKKVCFSAIDIAEQGSPSQNIGFEHIYLVVKGMTLFANLDTNLLKKEI